MSQPLDRPGRASALMQSNVDQGSRNDAATPTSAAASRREAMHVDFAALAGVRRRPRPDLIVWPETSYPGDWDECAPGEPDEASRRARPTDIGRRTCGRPACCSA